MAERDYQDEGSEQYERPAAQQGRGGFGRFFDPVFGVTSIATGIYYFVLWQPAMRQTVLAKYTSEHAVEYVIVFFFIWGIVDILFKLAGFPKEKRALRQEWLPPCRGREPLKNAITLLKRLRSMPRAKQESRIGRCLGEMLESISDKGSARDAREILQRLSEKEEDRVHGTYALARFIVAVTPILGFLGTVVHFGTALSGISFDEMTEKLPEVVGEMGTAFNTTTVALAAAMSVMFLMFICERIDQGILHAIERFLDHEVVARFESREQKLEPFLEVIQEAHREAIGAVAETLDRRFDVWTGALDTILQRFEIHQAQSAEGWQQALGLLQQRQEEQGAEHREQLKRTLTLFGENENRHMAEIQTLLEKAAGFREETRVLTETLNSIAEGQGALVNVQDSLTQNLRLLHETKQIDDALHGLTAAIHLLTGRYRPTEKRDAA